MERARSDLLRDRKSAVVVVERSGDIAIKVPIDNVVAQATKTGHFGRSDDSVERAEELLGIRF